MIRFIALSLLILAIFIAAPTTLINITNYDDKTVTVAKNLTNVYVVAYRYCKGHVASFRSDTSAAAFQQLYSGTEKKRLPYTGNYDKLQSAAGRVRDQIPLGFPALDNAITNLIHYNFRSTAAALLVLIQSTAEAARFKYIAQEVANYDFPPNSATISLENNWAALSKQIQIAQTRKGQLQDPVYLKRPSGELFQVTNDSSRVVKNNIALLIYFKVSTLEDNSIIPTVSHLGAMRMPITTPTNGHPNAWRCDGEGISR